MNNIKSFMRKIFSLTLASSLLVGVAIAKEETITIGYTGPLSGGAALYGKNALTGIQKAADDINKEGIRINNNTYKLNIVALDDKYSPSETAINGRRLVQEHGAKFIFVPHSGGTFALQTFNVRSNFMIFSYSSLPAIIEKKNPLTVRIPESFDIYFPTYIKTQMEKYGKKLGVAVTNSDYGRTYSKAFEKAWKDAGGEVVSNNLMAYNTSADFYSSVGRTLDAKPDVILIGGPSEPTALVAKQIRELGFKGGFIVTDQAKFNEMQRILGDYSMLEGAIGTIPMQPEVRTESIPFIEEFVKNHPEYKGKQFTNELVLTYATVHILANAMKQANSKDDLKAIYSKLDAAVQALEPKYNPIQINHFVAPGSFTYNSSAVVVKDGKLQRAPLIK